MRDQLILLCLSAGMERRGTMENIITIRNLHGGYATFVYHNDIEQPHFFIARNSRSVRVYSLEDAFLEIANVEPV